MGKFRGSDIWVVSSWGKGIGMGGVFLFVRFNNGVFWGLVGVYV